MFPVWELLLLLAMAFSTVLFLHIRWGLICGQLMILMNPAGIFYPHAMSFQYVVKKPPAEYSQGRLESIYKGNSEEEQEKGINETENER